jgi:RNA polymerase sigma-70 factor (ECF subfamily)
MSHVSGTDGFLDGLYRLHHQELCRYIQRHFGPGPPEPEDIVHTAFIRFAGHADCAGLENPLGYWRQIARNIAIDERRRSGKQEIVFRKIRVAEESSHDSSAEDVLSSRQELERLAVIVAVLKPMQRAAFLMNRIDGLRYAEIGRRLGIPESSARWHVNQALDHIVKRMRQRP